MSRMPAITLSSIAAILILSPEDNSRIYAKYYSAPHTHAGPGSKTSAHPAHTLPVQPYPTLKAQKAFEKGLLAKTAKQNSDIILYDNRVIVFKTESDVMIYVVGNGQGENEIMLYNVVLCIRDTLLLILKNAADRRTLIENYDLLTLTLDEIVDDGIILETDPVVVSSRVSRPPAQDVTMPRGIDLSEQGLLNVWEFGKAKLGERIRAGLA